MSFADVIKWQHKESASNYITGVTEDGLVDIVEGEWDPGGFWMSVPIKVEFYINEPYWETKFKNGIHRTHNESIALDWVSKRKVVMRVENEYTFRVYVENVGCDGIRVWWTERDGAKIRIPNLNEIQSKVERLNRDVIRKRIKS